MKSDSPMRTARIIVAWIGIILPYAARIPGGEAWVEQYTENFIGGFLAIEICNAIAWGGIVAVSFLYRRPESIVLPSAFGFAFLAWAHYRLDLAADAQAAIALIFIPIYALIPIGVGGALGYLVDHFLRRGKGASD